MANKNLLDVDPSILEKNLLITGNQETELNALFPKTEEVKSTLTKPTPVANKMSDEQVDLEQPDLNLDKDIDKSDNATPESKNVIGETLQASDQAEKNSDPKDQDEDDKMAVSDIPANTIKKQDQHELSGKIRRISNALITKELIVKIEDIGNKTKGDEVSETKDKSGHKVDIANQNASDKAGVSKTVTKAVKAVEKAASISKVIKEPAGINDELEPEISITLEYDDVLMTDITIDEPTTKQESPPTKSSTKIDPEESLKTEKKEKTNHDQSASELNEDIESVDKQVTSAGRCLWVSGLSHATRANDLKRHFVAQGRVIGAKVVCNSRSPSARCYGYIIMSTAEEANLCVKNLHHSKLLNRFISVQKAKSDKTSNEAANDTSDKGQSNPKMRHKTVEGEKTKPSNSTDKSPNPITSIIADDKEKKKDDSSNDDSSRKKDARGNKKGPASKEDTSKRRYPQKETKHEEYSKRSEIEIRDRKMEKYKRMEELRERERINIEQRRLREMQRKQREEAAKLERERQLLRIERERLQKEKMELLRLEKEQLEKEREELKRQKQKIEEAANQKKVHLLEQRSDRKRSVRSPPRRSDEIPMKIMKKHDGEKYKETKGRPERMASAVSKYKEPDNYKTSHTNPPKYKNPHPPKESYQRNEYKGLERQDEDFSRSTDHSKYIRYVDDKKMDDYKNRESNLKPLNTDYSKTNDYSTKRNENFNLQMVPPRISTSEANHFNVLPMSHSTSYGSSNARIRDEFHGKELFAPPPPSVRSIDRVSDRFPQDRHVEPVDMNRRARPYSSSSIDCFPKNDSRLAVRPDRFDKTRVSRDDHHRPEPAQPHVSGGRYHEHEREYRHHDQWYPENTSSKRSMMSTLASQRDIWLKNETNNPPLWESSRYYDPSMRPPGTYSSTMDRSGKMDRH